MERNSGSGDTYQSVFQPDLPGRWWTVQGGKTGGQEVREEAAAGPWWEGGEP